MARKLWLPSYFSSGMVLQQRMPVHLCGKASPKQSVSISLSRKPFDGRAISPLDQDYGEIFSVSCQTDSQGEFTCTIPAFDASLDPFSITIKVNKETVTYSDVLFGEVWLSGGQSNMEMPLGATRSASQLDVLANLSYVRVLRQSASGLDQKHKAYSYQPLIDLCSAGWVYGDQPAQIKNVSAVAFIFARELHLDLKIPVGIIESAVGGSPIQSWLERSTVDSHEQIRQYIHDSGFYRTEKDWNMNADPDLSARQPAALFNHKIAPLAGLAMRGMLWYQGESDYSSPDYYRLALPAMISDWQKLFRPADDRGLNFLYVQLAPYFYGHRDDTKLAQFNEMLAAVRRKLSVPTALLPIYDIVPTFAEAPVSWRHPIHPDTKQPIGQRLKTLALGLSYGRKQAPSAPECVDIEKIGGKLMLSFDPVGDGLRLVGDAGRLCGFTICGPDRIFLEAQAKLLYGVRVLVWHDQISQPEAVAYAYTDFCQDANLVSREHIPVMPFRSDRLASRHLPPQEWIHCESTSVWACPKLEEHMSTGWQPAWTIRRGSANFKIEPANKSEGDAAFLISYRTDEQQIFSFGPALEFASQFPPLDLSMFDRLSIDVFNADMQMKHLQLEISASEDEQILPERKVIMSALRWQTLIFPLGSMMPEQLSAVRQLTFLLEDRKQKGELYLDNIRLLLPERSV